LAALAIPIALVLGGCLARSRHPWVWRILILAPLIIPGPVFGIGMQTILRRPRGSLPFGFDDTLADWSQTLGPLMLVWVLRFAPVAAFVVERVWRSIPR